MENIGNWNNSSLNGVSTRNLNNYRSNSNNNVSFRSGDYDSLPETTMVDTGVIGISTPAMTNLALDETKLNSHHIIKIEDIANLDILYNAYLNARRSKRYKKVIYDFENNIGFELIKLREELLTGTYKVSKHKKIYYL